MAPWLIVAFVIGSLLTITLVVIALFWLEARRTVRRRERDDLDRRLRALFAADDTVPIDVVDGPWDRSAREIHHSTVPEFTAVNAEFLELMQTNFPNQT